MLKEWKADLHVHTCLSPCADLKMSPSAIAEAAHSRDITILGICDHNSAENVPALVEAARRYDIAILAGMEITSREEVHILALFDSMEQALAVQLAVYDHLPGKNDEETFGLQVVVNADGEVLRFNDRLLIGASTLSVERVVDLIHQHQGLAIASHIDREGFSLIGQLGFIPPGLELDALEISPLISWTEARETYHPTLPLTCSSDAHFPEDIGKGTTSFYIEEATTGEIKKALLHREGRKVLH